MKVTLIRQTSEDPYAAIPAEAGQDEAFLVACFRSEEDARMNRAPRVVALVVHVPQKDPRLLGGPRRALVADPIHDAIGTCIVGFVGKMESLEARIAALEASLEALQQPKLSV